MAASARVTTRGRQPSSLPPSTDIARAKFRRLRDIAAESPKVDRQLRRIAKGGWHLPAGTTENVLVNLAPTALLLWALALEQRANEDEGTEADTLVLPGGDAEAAERLKKSDREIREARAQLEKVGLCEVQTIRRGAGWRLHLHREAVLDLPVRPARTCVRAKERPKLQEPPPEPVPAKLCCPAGIPKCPVTQLYAVGGILTNELPLPGDAPSTDRSPMPNPPAASEDRDAGGTRSRNLSSNFCQGIEQVQSFVVKHLPDESVPDATFVTTKILEPLGDTPLEVLLEIVAKNIRKVKSAGFLGAPTLIDAAKRTHAARLKHARASAAPVSNQPEAGPPLPLPDDTGTTWSKVRDVVHTKVSDEAYRNWIAHTRQAAHVGDRLRVWVPDEAHRIALELDFAEHVSAAIAQLKLGISKVDYEVWRAP